MYDGNVTNKPALWSGLDQKCKLNVCDQQLAKSNKPFKILGPSFSKFVFSKWLSGP